jgi:hypothetical protein
METTATRAEAPEVATDKAISETYGVKAKAYNELRKAAKYGWDTTQVQAAFDGASALYEEANSAYTGWDRFFLVPGGHIHSSMHCSTCNRMTNGWNSVATTFVWLTDLSGLDIEAAINEYGSILCTVCYPDAPVEYTNGTNKQDADMKARKQTQAALRKAPEFKAFNRNFERISGGVAMINRAHDLLFPKASNRSAYTPGILSPETVAKSNELRAEGQALIAKWTAKFEEARDAILPVIEELGVQASDVNTDPSEARCTLPSL